MPKNEKPLNFSGGIAYLGNVGSYTYPDKIAPTQRSPFPWSRGMKKRSAPTVWKAFFLIFEKPIHPVDIESGFFRGD
jgi:hypothetical protein